MPPPPGPLSNDRHRQPLPQEPADDIGQLPERDGFVDDLDPVADRFTGDIPAGLARQDQARNCGTEHPADAQHHVDAAAAVTQLVSATTTSGRRRTAPRPSSAWLAVSAASTSHPQAPKVSFRASRTSGSS